MSKGEGGAKKGISAVLPSSCVFVLRFPSRQMPKAGKNSSRLHGSFVQHVSECSVVEQKQTCMFLGQPSRLKTLICDCLLFWVGGEALQL